MSKFLYALSIAAFTGLSLGTVFGAASNTAVVADTEAARYATLRNLSVKNGEVSGEIVNNSGDRLRDVVLEIRYSWRWKNEFRPGKDDAGRTVYYTAAKEIPPRESVRFEYKPAPPLPTRNDGYYVIDAKIAGLERVYF